MVGSSYRSIALLVLAASFVLPGCVAATKYNQLNDELGQAQDDLAYAEQQLRDAEQLLQDASIDDDALAIATARADDEALRRKAAEDQLAGMQGKESVLGRAGIDVFYDEKTGEAGFRAESDVFFSSGGDELTKSGKSSLDLIVDQLKTFAGPIRVDGHTDSDPVVKTKAKYPYGNIQLGAQRAISVREYLIEKGIEERRIWIASHGPFKPLDVGTSTEAKKRNRRVEIMIPVGKPAHG
ncbi:MAG: hypothetical protein DRQ55_01615 [Planctomycetota bacterium]|nr:MAG: hypothetical protein DRQ55_01615 [Planctomycetota bacterium]